MRNIVVMLLLLLSLAVVSVAHARGGQDADDCPPGSTDPDCKDAGSATTKAK